MSSTKRKTVLCAALLVALLGLAHEQVAGQEDPATPTRPRTVSKATSVRAIAANEKVTINGNVTRVDKDSFSVCDLAGAEVVVMLTSSTSIKTHRRGIFQGAAERGTSALSPGLNVEVEGRGNEAGRLVAKKIRFYDSDYRAQTEVDTRAIPIEAEQEKLAGQIDETAAVAATARREAKTAQDGADKAQTSADKAQGTADTALSDAKGAQQTALAAQARIGAIDDYDSVDSLMVNFKVNSAELTQDGKVLLDQLAAKTTNAKGYIIEVAAFTDGSGGSEFNRRLSQRRAQAVMDYLIVTCQVPLRRVIPLYSGGEMSPIADNRTRQGRALNRRAEVRMLTSKGLAATEQVGQSR